MSRAISESLELLSETLVNCKTNLKEKEVADVDNIKISDVDEKIAEIQAGSSSEFKYLENVTVNGETLKTSGVYSYVFIEDYEKVTLKFTPKKDVYFMINMNSTAKITPTQQDYGSDAMVKQGTEYSIVCSNSFSCAFLDEHPLGGIKKFYQDLDFFSCIVV